MNDQTIKRVKELLATYHARERQISVLLYELDHAPRETPAEFISELAYAKSTGMCGMPRRKSTNYIAVNYKEQLKQVNEEVICEISMELYPLKQEQERLNYYMSLLEQRKADVLKQIYIVGATTSQVAEQYGLTYRTIDRIKKAAISFNNWIPVRGLDG